MDPIADMFTRLRNGYRAKKATVILPYSKIKEGILRLLAAKHYISDMEKKGRKVRKFLEVGLRYDGVSPALTHIRRLSKPSRRLYLRKDEIRPVRQGFGLLIVSTSKGLMSGEEARKSGLGGEAIAEIW